ncbi:MAG: 50S ribosomal protein L29 [Candidatus Nealsonbacteria bacterium]
MKIKELRLKQNTELNKLLQEKKEKLRQFYFNLSSGKVKNIKEIRETKKDIARILTILKNTKKEK